MKRLQALIQWFLPQELRFFDYVAAASLAAADAANLMVQLSRAEGRDAQLSLVERIRDAEHAGDAAMKAMMDALDQTFVTPIDREDLYHLTSAVESVSDFISATSNHLTVHQMDTLPDGTRELADILQKATGQFSEAIGYLKDRQGFDKIRAACRSLQHLEHEADVVFRGRLGDLFAHEKDAIKLIKHKEFLEGLEDAVDQCAKVGNVLEAIVIKNG